MRPHIAFVGPLILISPAIAQSFESFEGGSNAAGWSFNAPIQGPTMPGGYQGDWYYRGSGINATVPVLRSAVGAPGVTGDVNARGIYAIHVALRVEASDIPVANLHPAIILVSTNNTPTDPSDDWGAYILSGLPLGPLGAWRPHRFGFQGGTQTPLGWRFISFGPNSPPNPTWFSLITLVDRIDISFGDPTQTYAPQSWTVGVDAITMSTCRVNCDGSRASPFLNTNDFVCFLNHFAAGDTFANCDQSTNPPVLNVNDFIWFNELFAAGCSAP